ncbi:MAG: hypothetical protein JKY65_16815 [Planctomycetes bacterium]|nr:hypothetical protein [Planctomycetota bacterium]
MVQRRSNAPKKTSVCLRLCDDLLGQVDAIADVEERSRADVVRRLAKAGLRARASEAEQAASA